MRTQRISFFKRKILCYYFHSMQSGSLTIHSGSSTYPGVPPNIFSVQPYTDQCLYGNEMTRSVLLDGFAMKILGSSELDLTSAHFL